MGMREIAPYGLRMSQKLKTRLEEKADSAGRSLQKEIVMRLEKSLDEMPACPEIREPSSSYAAELSDAERQMLYLFKSWPVEKQLSFLVLFD